MDDRYEKEKILLNAIIAKTVDDEVFCDVARACLQERQEIREENFLIIY